MNVNIDWDGGTMWFSLEQHILVRETGDFSTAENEDDILLADFDTRQHVNDYFNSKRNGRLVCITNEL